MEEVIELLEELAGEDVDTKITVELSGNGEGELNLPQALMEIDDTRANTEGTFTNIEAKDGFVYPTLKFEYAYGDKEIPF